MHYCNMEEEIDFYTYDVIINKINRENTFRNFDFDFYNSKKKNYYEYEGINYKFKNLH